MTTITSAISSAQANQPRPPERLTCDDGNSGVFSGRARGRLRAPADIGLQCGLRTARRSLRAAVGAAPGPGADVGAGPGVRAGRAHAEHRCGRSRGCALRPDSPSRPTCPGQGGVDPGEVGGLVVVVGLVVGGLVPGGEAVVTVKVCGV